MVLIVPDYAKAEDWYYSPEPYNYKNGLLDQRYILDGLETNLKKEAYDNDINTRDDLGRLKYIRFKTPVNIEASYLQINILSGQSPHLIMTKVNGEKSPITRINQGYKDFKIDNVVSIEFQYYDSRASLYEIDFFGSYQEYDSMPILINSITSGEDYIKIDFTPPEDSVAVDVWLNNQRIGRTTEKTYTFEGLNAGTDYDLMLVDYKGNDQYGESVIRKATTKKGEVGEVKDLNAVAESYKQVNLNWTNPTQSNFSHVTIYRDEVEKQGILNKFNFFMVAHAADPTKLFETNGTYFIDHSVAASTSYEYLVTTTDDSGKESVGVSQTVQTLKKPNPDPPISEMEKDENGDYRVTWTSPTEGKVIIRVGGEDYATVNASQGSFLIPGNDMVYSIFGAPQVQVVAIDLDGDTSKGNSPGPPGSTGEDGGSGGNGGSGGIIGTGEIKGIHAKDILGGTMSFIKLLGPIILLGIIIFLVPYIIRVIKHSMQNRKQRV